MGWGDSIMPTGYTSDILEFKSFKDFALQCARAFGACVSMRDQSLDKPIPEELPLSDYHLEALRLATDKLQKIIAASDEELIAQLEQEYTDDVLSHLKDLSHKKEEERAYRHFLEMAKAWNPPSSEHKGLKDFMITQLEETIKFDCYYSGAPQKPSLEMWKDSKFKEYRKDIIYHTDKYEKEKQRNHQNNLWIKQLRESLA